MFIEGEWLAGLDRYFCTSLTTLVILELIKCHTMIDIITWNGDKRRTFSAL